MAREAAKRRNCSSLRPKRTFRLGSTLVCSSPPIHSWLPRFMKAMSAAVARLRGFGFMPGSGAEGAMYSGYCAPPVELTSVLT